MDSHRPIELVLFFTLGVSLDTWDEGGMFAREIALYQSLQQHNVQVTFVTYGDKHEFAHAQKIPGIRVICNDLNLPSAWYRQKLAWFPPKGSVFKSNQIDGADLALAAARHAGVRFIARCGYLLSINQAHQHGPDSKQAQVARLLEQKVFSGADHVVVTTAAIAQLVQQRYGITSSKISVVPNYVETNRFRPSEQSQGKSFRVGFVGRLSREKNLSALISAVSALNVELSLVGNGPEQDVLAGLVRASKANVKFLGRIPNEELPGFLNSCNAFVLPSLYEGHPKSLLEAMACRLPVIGTRVPGIRELIVDGENGLLCETDPGSLRSAIARLASDAELRARLGSNARTYIEQNFALARIVNLELDILNQLAA